MSTKKSAQNEVEITKKIPGPQLKKLGANAVVSQSTEQRLKQIEERLGAFDAYFKDMAKHMEEMHRYLVWRRFWSLVRVVLIVGPILLAIIYLPPILDLWLAPYKELFQGTAGFTSGQGLDVGNALDVLKSQNPQ